MVVESINISRIDILDELRNLLKDKTKFKLRLTIPVQSNMPIMKKQELLIMKS